MRRTDRPAASEVKRAGRCGGVPTLHTFGDSILDCGHYNGHGLHPAGLMVRNDDILFPEFEGDDLASRLGGKVTLHHHAVDGARVDGLARQLRTASVAPEDVALLTIGGNDLLGGLIADRGPGFDRFQAALDGFLATMPRGRVLLGNVYDPTLGDDAQNFLPVPPEAGRANLARMNGLLASLARTHDAVLVDVHAHFLKGEASWFTHVIEPSLEGAHELRRIFLAPTLALFGEKQ